MKTRIYYMQCSKQRNCAMLVPHRCFPGACTVLAPLPPLVLVAAISCLHANALPSWPSRPSSGAPMVSSRSLGTLPLGHTAEQVPPVVAAARSVSLHLHEHCVYCWWRPLHDAHTTCATSWPCQAPQRMASLHALCPWRGSKSGHCKHSADTADIGFAFSINRPSTWSQTTKRLEKAACLVTKEHHTRALLSAR